MHETYITLIDDGFTIVSLAGETLIWCELSGSKLIMREPYGYIWELEKQ